MDKDEPFVYDEVDYETPKQSPQSSQTWPMDKIRQSRFHRKMSSLLSPVTPKRNYSLSNPKSLLLQCLHDSKSDPLPRKRFLASYSDDGILMDGVLVTSATGKKVSGSPSSSLGRSARSSVIRSKIKNAEFSSPRTESGCNQENIRPQQSSAGKRNTLANSPFTKVETPKVTNPSKLQANAAPFILTPRSQRLASSLPLQQLPCDHDPNFQWGNPPSQLPPRPIHGPPLPYLLPPPSPHGTHYLARSPSPTGYQMPHDYNQSPTRNDPLISLPTTPFSSQPNTNTIELPVYTPISTTTPKANLSTSTTTYSSRLDLPPSVDGLEAVKKTPNLALIDGLETVTKESDVSPTDGLETVTKKPEVSPSPRIETMTTKKDWSPSDDGLETLTEAQIHFMKPQDRVLPDDAFKHYKYGKRLPVFDEICLD